SPVLLVVAPVDARSEPRRDGSLRERPRAVAEKLQPLLKRCGPAEVADFGETGMLLGCTRQIIGAAIFYRFGQPMRHREEHRHLAALPAKIGRSGREKGFEQGVDVAGTNIFACDSDETPPDCVAIKCVNSARSPLRQLNLAPAN